MCLARSTFKTFFFTGFSKTLELQGIKYMVVTLCLNSFDENIVDTRIAAMPAVVSIKLFRLPGIKNGLCIFLEAT